MALIMPLHQVVPLMVLLDYLASLGHSLKYRREALWKDVLILMPFALLGILIALYLFRNVDASLLKKALAVFIIVYGLYSLRPLLAKTGISRIWSAPAGLMGGLIGSLFGTGGPFYVIYLRLRGLDKSQFRATVAGVFLLDGGMRLFSFVSAGFYTKTMLPWLLLALPVMVIALLIGGRIHTRLTQQAFERIISVMLIVSGVALLIK